MIFSAIACYSLARHERCNVSQFVPAALIASTPSFPTKLACSSLTACWRGDAASVHFRVWGTRCPDHFFDASRTLEPTCTSAPCFIQLNLFSPMPPSDIGRDIMSPLLVSSSTLMLFMRSKLWTTCLSTVLASSPVVCGGSVLRRCAAFADTRWCRNTFAAYLCSRC